MNLSGPRCDDARIRLARLQEAFAAGRIPVTGSLALTHRCNLRCVHCYLGGQRHEAAQSGGELAAARWISVVDEIVREGCIDLLLTGGEPLLLPDFPEIYRHARRSGCLVTVFTNGTLLEERHIALFQDYQPQAVEITLHATTAATYERVSGVRGSFAEAMRGIRLLHDGGVRLLLKTVILQENRGEVGAVAALARDLGVPFRVDAAVFAGFDGNRAPLASRLTTREAVAVEFAAAERARRWEEEHRRCDGTAAAGGDRLFVCGAGLTSFHVDPRGTLLPCSLLAGPAHRLEDGGFRRGWDGPIRDLRSVVARPGHPCDGCRDQHLCGSCPALAALENGDPQSVPRHLCSLGAQRRLAIEAVSLR